MIVGKKLTCHSNFINIILQDQKQSLSMSGDEFTFLENILLSQIFDTNFVCMFVVIHVM